MKRLVDAGLVDGNWASAEHKGMISNSVVVFAVRKGNPKGIKTWDDLTKDGVEVITPNPFTSGGARWNVMAAYGAQRELGRSHDEAVAYLEELFKHVSVQDKSARESLQTFTGGKGDVLLAYENEAITAQQKGEELDYVIPDQTILIENPIAVTKDAGSQAAGVPRLPPVRAGAEGVRREGLPLGHSEPGRRLGVPEAEDALHDPGSRRLGRGAGDVLRPGGRDHGGHPARGRGGA